METITSGFNNDKDWEKKAKTLTNFYSSPSKENLNKKNKKEITGKIGNKKGTNNKKELEEKCGHDFTDYVLTYATKGNFEKFGENDIKNMFEKNGVHIYDIRKNLFTNGKYNVIKFKVRENVGEQILEEKMKEIENILNSKEYKISIKKEEQRNNKKNLRNVAKAPFSKKTIFIDEIDNKNNLKQNENNKNKNNKKNIAFSSQYVMINNNYKNHYKEEELKNKVNK